MSKTTKIFFVLYGTLMFGVFAEIFFLSMKKRHNDIPLQQWLSDTAIYTEEKGMRFYSLESANSFFEDPLLLPASKADFVYRMHP